MLPAKAITIQTLGSSDVEWMRDLLHLFGRAFDEPQRYSDKQPSDDYLSRLLSSEMFLALVAVHDGIIVGGLAGYVLPKFEQEQWEFYIYDLAVEEAYRRQGIATAMIRKLQHIVATRGGDVIFVQADDEDHAALELYSRHGQRQAVSQFDIDVRT